VKVAFYRDVREELRDGDIVLYRRGRRLSNLLIGVAGRSPYVHAGMLAWWGDDLMLLETIQGAGGRAILFSSQVQQYPGKWDVFRVKDPDKKFVPGAAISYMRRSTSRPYGWWGLARTALAHLPVVRLFVPVDTNDTSNGSLPFCSHLVSSAARHAGADLVPNLADRLTEPSDLGRSALLEGLYTLLP